MNGVQVSAKEKKAKKSNNNSEAQEKAVPRRNTRSAAPKEPISSISLAMITPVIEESVILRSGNPAKPSKFWKYVDES
ncbi:hypothetical protein CVT25_011979 [Psilocybe cyanescens]|uniref:Uncharacterized protein n=1 Tax=Psilocybe cyanescens TaxID=93625 RepID=A0A409XLD4_PSICY|nr:hypothetical protein CVT25_011979 [Psilocybe cyanescens]